jgi:glycerophosphoryl diester phosphodiesterase
MRLFVLLLCLSTSLWAQPWVVAHRGGVRLGAENSLTTFRQARDLGVDAVELDIHQSRDGALVVIHDETLQRTHGHPGKVSQLSLAELRAAGVPTLEEALDALGDLRLLIEIKQPRDARYEGLERRLLQLLRERDCLSRVVVISFDADSLVRLRQLDPGIATGYLSGKAVDPAWVRSHLRATYYCPHYSRVDAELVEKTRAEGLKLGVWTVNGPDDMRSMIRLGCNAITTDDPALLKQVLQEESQVENQVENQVGEPTPRPGRLPG